MKKLYYLFALLLFIFYIQAKKHYSFTFDPIDIVIPGHEKDLEVLPMVVDAAYKHVVNGRRIIVISNKKLTDKAEWFDEKNFPFNKYSIALEMFNYNQVKALNYINSKNSRIGWIYQQFLKLFAMFVVPDISSNILIIDADTILLKDISFQDISGAGLYNPGTEYNKPYFVHGEKVLKNFKKIFPHYSGISHHMLFQRSILEDLMHCIEREHGIESWRALAQHINHADFSGISEYELYFNFAFANTDQVKIRHLQWANIDKLNLIDSYKKKNFDYVSCHSYMRK